MQYYKFAKSPAAREDSSNGDNSMSDRVYIFDTTLRDGEQSPGCSMTVPEKLRMARKLVELGVDILEAGFPIASEGEYEAVTAVSKEFPLAQVAALARCCTPDVERAAAALSHARRPRIHLVIATSEIHLKHKLKKTQQQVLDEAVGAVELARRHVDDVEFSAEDGARTAVHLKVGPITLAQMPTPDQVVDVQRYRGHRGVVQPAHNLAVTRAVAVLANKSLDKIQQFTLLFGGSNILRVHAFTPLGGQHNG